MPRITTFNFIKLSLSALSCSLASLPLPLELSTTTAMPLSAITTHMAQRQSDYMERWTGMGGLCSDRVKAYILSQL
jgi:hypothetical protein